MEFKQLPQNATDDGVKKLKKGFLFRIIIVFLTTWVRISLFNKVYHSSYTLQMDFKINLFQMYVNFNIMIPIIILYHIYLS